MDNDFAEQPAAFSAPQAPFCELDGLSYEEYFVKVDEMIQALKHHWKLEQRVKALKVAIQLSKLLANSSQIKLYPKKFKMITGTLDEFCQMIYNRIQARASEDDGEVTANDDESSRRREENFKLDPRELAKETCRNWFLKIASIRELVPRFYAELAILKSCDILLKPTTPGMASIEQQFYAQSLRRLTKTAWGFGDPIVAIHARLYLCRIAIKLIDDGDDCNRSQGGDKTNNLFDILLANIKATATLVSQLDTNNILKTLQAQCIDMSVFFDIVSGALQGQVNFVTGKFDLYSEQWPKEAREQLVTMLNCLKAASSKPECSIPCRNILLHATFKAIPGDIIADSAAEYLECLQAIHCSWRNSIQIDSCTNTREAQSITWSFYSSLGSFAIALDISDCFELESRHSETKSMILESLARIIEDLHRFELDNSLGLSQPYLRCFTSFFSYTNHYGSAERIDSLLDKFIHSIEPNRRYVEHSAVIIELVKILFSNKRKLDEFSGIFKLKSLSKLLELLRKDEHKFETSKWILETMRANLKLNKLHKDDRITDLGLINSILKLSSTINDSLSLLTGQDDIRHLSQVVTYFLDKISVQDYKEHLNFFSRCRGAMGNLTPVLEYLARRVLKFAIEFREVERKRSARQDYLNGCLAFTFVTVPALQDDSIRLELLIEGLNLAQSHMSLSLADYYVKQALINVNQQGLAHETVERPFIVTNHEATSHNTSPRKVSKRLVDQVDLLLRLIVKFQDHIDLKHKIFANNLIKQSFGEHSQLVDCLQHLNTVEELEGD